MKKNEDLLPTESICRELALLCNRVMSALEALIVDPGPGCPGIEDVKVVGSFKKGTMLNGSVTADVVCQLRSLPTHEVVAKLSRRVLEEMRLVIGYTPVTLLPNETGFEISSADARLVFWLEIDSNIHFQCSCHGCMCSRTIGYSRTRTSFG